MRMPVRQAVHAMLKLRLQGWYFYSDRPSARWLDRVLLKRDYRQIGLVWLLLFYERIEHPIPSAPRTPSAEIFIPTMTFQSSSALRRKNHRTAAQYL